MAINGVRRGEESRRLTQQDLSTLEQDINRLKNDFEQYFIGLQRMAPEELYQQVKRKIAAFSTSTSVNTAVKFRLASITARFHSFNQRWTKVLRDIEDGKHAPHLFKMKVKDRRKEEGELKKGLSPGEKPGPEKEPEKEPLPAGKAGASGPDVDRIYRNYIAARKRCNESVNIPKEKIAAIIEKQAPQIKQKYKCRDVDFKVVIKGGRTVLKAVPRK